MCGWFENRNCSKLLISDCFLLLKKFEAVRDLTSPLVEMSSGTSASIFLSVSSTFIKISDLSSSYARFANVRKVLVEFVIFEVPGRPV